MLAGHTVALMGLFYGLLEVGDIHPEVGLQHTSRRTIHHDKCHEDVLDGYILILHLTGKVLRLVKYLVGTLTQVGFTTGDLGQVREGDVVGFLYSGTLYSELGEEEVHQAISRREQAPEQVRGLNGLVAIPASQIDGSL